MISLATIRQILTHKGVVTPKSSNLKPSAVLVPIVERDNGLHLLFTQRTEHLKHHAGQISFPGGRMDKTDTDLIHTALRETEEEIGVTKDYIEVIGKLPIQPTVSGYIIQPIVAIIENHYEMTINPDEVADAFEVPLDFLLDESNRSHVYKEFNGQRYPIYSIPYQERDIWGATAGIIVAFSKQLQNHFDN